MKCNVRRAPESRLIIKNMDESCSSYWSSLKKISFQVKGFKLLFNCCEVHFMWQCLKRETATMGSQNCCCYSNSNVTVTWWCWGTSPFLGFCPRRVTSLWKKKKYERNTKAQADKGEKAPEFLGVSCANQPPTYRLYFHSFYQHKKNPVRSSSCNAFWCWAEWRNESLGWK